MLKIIISYLALIQMVYGYINIYPSFFYEELKLEGTSKTFILTNRSDSDLRYRIYFEEKSLENLKVEVYPKSIKLSPYEEKEIKVLITPQKKLKPGVYGTTLVIKEIGAYTDKNKKIYSMLKLKLSGYYGNLNMRLNGDIKRAKDKLEIEVENKGERLGIFTAYLENEKKEWVYLDSFILKIGEKWKQSYDYNGKFKKIKIEDQDEKVYFIREIK